MLQVSQEICVHKNQGHRVLTHHGCIVSLTTLDKGLEHFITWLPSMLILVVHSGKAFDHHFLVKYFIECKLEKNDKIMGFGDSLPLIRKPFPGEDSYSVSKICKQLLNHSYNEHDALEDCSTLKLLIEYTLSQGVGLEDFTVSFSWWSGKWGIKSHSYHVIVLWKHLWHQIQLPKIWF